MKQNAQMEHEKNAKHGKQQTSLFFQDKRKKREMIKKGQQLV